MQNIQEFFRRINTPQEGEEVSKVQIYLYALGSGAGLFLYNVFNSFIQFFYTAVVGLPSQ